LSSVRCITSVGADWIETEAARDAGFDQLDDARNRGLGIVSLDKIEVARIHDDLTLRRLPEYFGEAHHWDRAG
jgi:hypothetical protein